MRTIQLVPVLIQKWWPSSISSSSPATGPSRCRKAVGKVLLDRFAFVSQKGGVRAGETAKEQGRVHVMLLWIRLSLKALSCCVTRNNILTSAQTTNLCRFHWHYWKIEPHSQYFEGLCPKKLSYLMTSLLYAPKGILFVVNSMHLWRDTVFYLAIVTQAD